MPVNRRTANMPGPRYIGTTGGGKRINSHTHPASLLGWSSRDHDDAAAAHKRRLEAAEDRRQSSDPELRKGANNEAAHHCGRMMMHLRFARQLESLGR